MKTLGVIMLATVLATGAATAQGSGGGGSGDGSSGSGNGGTESGPSGTSTGKEVPHECQECFGITLPSLHGATT